MNEKTKKLIHTVYTAVLSVMLGILGVLFIISCIGLFLDGENAFTRDSIGDALMKLLVPIIITLLLIIGAPILSAVLPTENVPMKATRDASLALNIAKRRASGKKFSPECAEGICAERKFRLIFTLAGVILFLISLIYPLIRTFTSTTFTAAGDANVQVMTASAVVIVFLIPTAAYAITMSYVFDKSRRRETALLKEATVDGEVALPVCECKICTFITKNKGVIINVIRCLILALAVVFIILGILNGGMGDVLSKAVKICRECIGLG